MTLVFALTRASCPRPAIHKVLLKAPLKAAADKHAKETASSLSASPRPLLSQDLLAAYLSVDWDVELADALLAAAEKEAGLIP